jgi:hypothetical protein
VVRTSDYGKVDEIHIREEFEKYGAVVMRFEIVTEKKALSQTQEKDVHVIISNMSHTKMLKKWLGVQKEQDVAVRELAYKLGKEIIQECLEH